MIREIDRIIINTDYRSVLIAAVKFTSDKIDTEVLLVFSKYIFINKLSIEYLLT